MRGAGRALTGEDPSLPRPTVKRIIEGREVRGYFKHKGHWIKGKHAPIIDEDTWLAAQVMKEKGSKYAPSRPGRRPARHLFAGVTLRCGYCGEAMLPRSNPDRYCCRTNKQIRGAGTCPMPVLTREQVDTYFLSVFECNFLDYEGTRQQIAEQLDRDVSNTAEALREADLAVARLEAQLTRVEADYLAEELGAAAYTRMSAKLEADRDAALAERNRLEDRTVELQRVRSNIDAESETLRRLDALRASIAASSKDAEANGDIETLRGVLAAAFARIYINDKGHAMSLECGSRWEGPRPIPTEPDRIMVTGEQTSYAIPFTNAVVQAMVIAGDR